MIDKTLDAVDSAIGHHITIQFSYQNRERVVCPYLLAKTTDGRFVCHGLQIAGNTSKGALLTPEFRYFYLENFDTVPMASLAPYYPPLIKAEQTPAAFIAEVINSYQE
jgi:hypothetical protein